MREQRPFPFQQIVFVAVTGAALFVFLRLVVHYDVQYEVTGQLAELQSLLENQSDGHKASEAKWPTFDQAWNCQGCSKVNQNEAEARLLVEQLTPGNNVADFGGGELTAFLSKFGVNVYSVDYYRPWHNIVEQHLKNEPRGDTVTHIYVPANRPDKLHKARVLPSRYAWYKDYIRAARNWTEAGVSFDVVLVDGRARPQVAIEALYMTPPSRLSSLRVIVHDIVRRGSQRGIRDHYLIIDDFYDRVGAAGMMTMFRPKEDAFQRLDAFITWPEWWCDDDVKPDARCSNLV